MAAPAYTKLPTDEPASPHIATPELGSPVYSGSPSIRPTAARPTVASPTYPTVHRPPPPASICTTETTDDNDVRTININITINIPSQFKLPCFSRRRCSRMGGAAAATREGFRVPVIEKIRRFVALLMVLFYISFIACAAAAWGIRNHKGMWEYPVEPLVVVTFSPILDFFVVVSTILLVRRHVEGTKPGFRYAFLLLMNASLFVLHVVLLVLFACWTHVFGYGWYYSGAMKDVVGLTLYVTITLTVIKLLLVVFVIHKKVMRGTFDGSVEGFRAMREEIRQAVRGENSETRADEGDARRSQEGAVFLA